jgi:hypothetical protein
MGEGWDEGELNLIIKMFHLIPLLRHINHFIWRYFAIFLFLWRN